MKALSIKQPWTWLIAAGYKDIENRSWPTSYRGTVFLHAGKQLDFDPNEEWDWDDIDRPATFETGGIVGQAEIVDCVGHSSSRWFFGPFGFVLRNAIVLPFRPCRGQLGFFEPDFSPAAEKQKLLPKQTSMLDFP